MSLSIIVSITNLLRRLVLTFEVVELAKSLTPNIEIIQYETYVVKIDMNTIVKDFAY